jgi:hypothetical protein
MMPKPSPINFIGSTKLVLQFLLAVVFRNALADMSVVHGYQYDHSNDGTSHSVVDVDEVMGIVSALQASNVIDDIGQYHADRDLQGGGQILQLINIVCGLIESIMIDEVVSCECSLGLSIGFSCTFEQELCAGPLCSMPTVGGTFDLLQTQVTFEYCAAAPTYNDAALPDFCVSVGGRLVLPTERVLAETDAGFLPAAVSSSTRGKSSNESRRIAKNTGAKDTTAKKEAPAPSPTTTTKEKREYLNTIEMTVDGKECQSSDTCNNGQGYVFDCTNVDERMIQSTCTPLQVITSYRQKPGTVEFLPQLDHSPHRRPHQFTAAIV